jgi:hypothetical protein
MNAWPGFYGSRAWNGMAAVLAVVFFRAALSARSQESPNPLSSNFLSGAVYNIILVTDSAPDLTDMESYLRSITSQYATPQEQAIAIWRWSQRLRKQTTNPVEDGHFVLDPIRMFNSYGYCNCGIISGINDALWLQEVSAVRIHAGQEGGFHLCYPDKIDVETSADSNSFALVGTAGFNQVFEPAADYVPRELDEASEFDKLPAGGRLAYAYRVLFKNSVPARYVRVSCHNRQGWGMLLSEVQVFDRVIVDNNVPPLVVLPPVNGTGN